MYPGGILEYDFTFAWTGVQKEGGTEYAITGVPLDGDAKCEQNYLPRAPNSNHLIPTLVLQPVLRR